MGTYEYIFGSSWVLYPIVKSISLNVILFYHHTYDIYQMFANIFMWWISIKYHCYRLWMKRNSINDSVKIPMSAFPISHTIWYFFSITEICSKSCDSIRGGIRNTRFLYLPIDRNVLVLYWYKYWSGVESVSYWASLTSVKEGWSSLNVVYC